MSGRCRVRKSPGRAILHELCWDFPRSEAGLGEQEGRGAKGRRSEPRRAGGGWWEGSAALSPPALTLLLQGSPPCDPLLTLPTSQPCPGPLPRSRSPQTGFVCAGKIESAMGRVSCPRPPSRVVLRVIAGGAQGRARCHCPLGSLGTAFGRGKGTESPFQHFPCPSPSLSRPAAGAFPALPIQGITLIHGEGLTRVSTGVWLRQLATCTGLEVSIRLLSHCLLINTRSLITLT